jgi:DNA-directed RNA polymerase specialized sigma24 family protein
VESRLAGLSDFERNLVLMQAYGYSQRDIAVMADVSMRTIVRRARQINDALFAELAEALGCRVALRRAPGGGRKKKQAA